jgi:hypothetical protein
MMAGFLLLLMFLVGSIFWVWIVIIVFTHVEGAPAAVGPARAPVRGPGGPPHLSGGEG